MAQVDRLACPYQKAIQLDPSDPSAPLTAEACGLVVDQSQAWFPCIDKCAAFQEDPNTGVKRCNRGGFTL